MSDKFFDLPSRIMNGFAEIDSDIVMDLYKTNEKYAELQQQISNLKKQNPFIDKIIEDNGEIYLTDDEHTVLIQYLCLCRQMDKMERQHIYFRGQTDVVAYFRKIKAI